MHFEEMIHQIDECIWGPAMLVLLLGAGIYLTIRTGFLAWRNLPYALRITLSNEAREKSGEGDVSSFSALTTTLAATIGTGNIVGVATAMVAGGPGALVWMIISSCFGLTTMFAECMLAVKYREVNERGEMSGGPMYTMKKGLRNRKFGRILGWWFALFAVTASFGIGNMTQSNSIASALNESFGIGESLVGIVVMVAAFMIIAGGIRSISKVSAFVVPVMAIFYIICGLIVIFGNIERVPEGIVDMFQMAFSAEAAAGGAVGTIVVSVMDAMRYGIARGVFSNEAGMGSAAITAAAATTDHPVKQGYISMTGTFWDTIVVCTITGLAISASGVLGMTEQKMAGTYVVDGGRMEIRILDNECDKSVNYNMAIAEEMIVLEKDTKILTLIPYMNEERFVSCGVKTATIENGIPYGTWQGDDRNIYHFEKDGSFSLEEPLEGTSLTIRAFETVLGPTGGWLISIGITLFAFATIIGWEYNGEKAFEYILGTHKYNVLYRILFAYIAYVGATKGLELVWDLSDIANALMVIPNLICLLLLSGEVARDAKEYEKVKNRG